MKQNIVFLSCLLLFCWATTTTTTNANASEQRDSMTETLFEQANILHTQGEVQQAIEQYLRIIKEHGVSASLLYNLANSYAAAGEVGLAVLNYERARHLAPGDADIQGNLEQVRKDAGLYRDDQVLYKRLAALLGADQWLLIAGCAFFCLGGSALLANFFKGKGQRNLHWFMIGSSAVCLLTLPPALLRYQDWKIGVVIAEDVHLLLSPFADSAVAGDIKAGRLIQPKGVHNEYVLVQTETGKSGWLAKKNFSLVTDNPGITPSF